MAHVGSVFIVDVEVLIPALVSLDLEVSLIGIVKEDGVEEKGLFLGEVTLLNQLSQQTLVNRQKLFTRFLYERN